MVPQVVVMNAIQREGRSFLMTRLEGSLGGDEFVRMGCDLACRGIRRAVDVHAGGNWKWWVRNVL